MVGIFRKNDVINFFLLLPYTILLRLHSLLNPQAYQVLEQDTTITKWLFSHLELPILQSVLGVILVFIQALVINVLANRYRIHKHPTALAGMVYIILVSCLPSFQILTPALIGSTFLLVATFNIFSTYKLSDAVIKISNAAISCATASIIYPPFAFSVFPLFLGLTMLRNFKMRERFQFLFGLLTVFWIIGSLLFFLNVLSWDILKALAFPGSFLNIWAIHSTSLWSLSVFILLILLALVNYYNYKKKKVIEIRKKIDFFYWLLFVAIFPLALFTDLTTQHFMFTTLSLSIFLSMTILLIKNRTMAELIHLITLSLIFYFQFAG